MPALSADPDLGVGADGVRMDAAVVDRSPQPNSNSAEPSNSSPEKLVNFIVPSYPRDAGNK
jgi:hypothetical protein